MNNNKKALRLWQKEYGDVPYAVDFHGRLMCRNAYGDDTYYISDHGKKVYCGWNIHHILPVACGGTNAESNLLCVNIETNEDAEDKITFWIEDCLYQVHRIEGTSAHEIVRQE